MNAAAENLIGRIDSQPPGMPAGRFDGDDNLALEGVRPRIIAQIEGQHVRRPGIAQKPPVQVGDGFVAEQHHAHVSGPALPQSGTDRPNHA